MYLVFFSHKAIAAVTTTKPLYKRSFRISALVIKVIALFLLLSSIMQQYSYRQQAQVAPLSGGCYRITHFIRNGDTVSDQQSWQTIDCSAPGFIRITTADKQRLSFYAATDSSNTLQLQNVSDENETHLLQVTPHKSDSYLLQGRWDKDTIQVLGECYTYRQYAADDTWFSLDK